MRVRNLYVTSHTVGLALPTRLLFSCP
jgi:hypothetical protein